MAQVGEEEPVYSPEELRQRFPDEEILIPHDPSDPYYCKLYELTLPPDDAYRYLPPEQKQVTTVTKKGPGQRRIFEGWNNLTQLEETKMKELKEALAKEEGIQIPEDFPDREFLRFLQAYEFKMHVTIEALKKHWVWRVDNYPCKLTQRAIRLINTGFIYSMGRDKRFRPCIVIDSQIFEMKKKAKPELFHYDVICTACQFIMQYLKHNMFVPGRIETWTVINNFNKLSLTQLPKKEMQKAIDMLQTNYMYILGKNWNVNCTATQAFLWRVFEMFVDRETREKISFHKENNPASLVNGFHPSQLEKRFGGQAETPRVFWPPHIPTQTFRAEDEMEMDLLSWEENERILQENPLLVRKPERKEEIKGDDVGNAVNDDFLKSMTSERINREVQEFCEDGSENVFSMSMKDLKRCEPPRKMHTPFYFRYNETKLTDLQEEDKEDLDLEDVSLEYKDIKKSPTDFYSPDDHDLNEVAVEYVDNLFVRVRTSQIKREEDEARKLRAQLGQQGTQDAVVKEPPKDPKKKEVQKVKGCSCCATF